MNNSSQPLEQQILILKRRFYVIAALFVGLGLVNVAFLMIVQYRLLNPSGNAQTTITQLDTKALVKKDYQVSLTSFYNNVAISEVAFQLELKKQSISTKGTTNCFTPEVPPMQNGCGFVIRPYAAGISHQQTRLIKLKIGGRIGQQDRIVFDLKNTDSNEIETSLGMMEGKYQEKSLALPSLLKPNQQIYARLWPVRGSEITISEVVIEYLSYQQMQPVTLELPQSYPGQKLQIFLDKNQNKLLDDGDIAWSCNEKFPGAQVVQLSDSQRVSLVRDESCLVNEIPESWQSDGGKAVLSPYTYLAVLTDAQNKKTVLNFEVTKDKNTFVIGMP